MLVVLHAVLQVMFTGYTNKWCPMTTLEGLNTPNLSRDGTLDESCICDIDGQHRWALDGWIEKGDFDPHTHKGVADPHTQKGAADPHTHKEAADPRTHKGLLLHTLKKGLLIHTFTKRLLIHTHSQRGCWSTHSHTPKIFGYYCRVQKSLHCGYDIVDIAFLLKIRPNSIILGFLNQSSQLYISWIYFCRICIETQYANFKKHLEIAGYHLCTCTLWQWVQHLIITIPISAAQHATVLLLVIPKCFWNSLDPVRFTKG